jgi:hypothetical protein
MGFKFLVDTEMKWGLHTEGHILALPPHRSGRLVLEEWLLIVDLWAESGCLLRQGVAGTP